MMRWIVEQSLRFRNIVVFFAAASMVFGVAELRGTPVDVFPEFAPPRVEIQTPCLGLSASEVEEFITVPLEQQLNGVPGLDTIRSSSVPQLSSITLIFEHGTDLLQARQLVQERLTTVVPTLPTWAAPPQLLQPLSSTSRVMKIGLSSGELSLIELSGIFRHTIRQRLLRVPGVANVAVWGQRKEQRQVLVDPERLREHNVSMNEVMEATANALDAVLLPNSPGAVVGTGGFVETGKRRLPINHVGPIVEPEELAEVSFRSRTGETLRLADVADVVTGHPPLIGEGVVNGRAGLLLIVEKFPNANTLKVTGGVEEALDVLRPGMRGIEIDSTIFRPATFIETAIDNLTRALLIGCMLVVFILALFLFEWRTAVISLVSIPLSLVAAGLVLSFRGETINTMVLAGLVISVGVVVDDAIIGIENIWRRLRQARGEGSERSTASIILEASLEVRSPIVYATLIIIVAVVPILFMEGLSGAFFRPLALSYALAVLASMVVALTLTPAMSLLLLRSAPLERRDSPVKLGLVRGYGALLSKTLVRPRRAYATVGAVTLLGLGVLPFLGSSLLPDFKERDFLMHWLTKPGTSLPEETRISQLACQELRTVPGVRNCGSHIGQALFADEVVGVDFGENWISVDPKADYDATLARVQDVVDGYPGLYRDVLTYLRERVKEVLTGTSETLVVRTYGEDLAVLRKTADEVNAALQGVEGLIDLHVELVEDIPHVAVEVDLEAAGRHGLKPGEIRRAAALLMQGIEVNDIWKPARVFDVTVWSTPETRNSLTSIQNLPIQTPSGEIVRLEDVANVRVEPTPNVIKREKVSRRIDVGANITGDRDLGSIAKEVEERLAAVDFPLGYTPELIGESAERDAAQSRLRLFALAAAVGIFLLLQVAFGSWRLAVLVFLTLPTALVGGVLAAYMSDGVISLGSLVGFLTVFGIAARNGILMINHFQHLEREEGEAFGLELVLRGAKERLTPILMTAGATGLALVPLAVSGAIPGHEVEHPMALVILGGLVTSTLLNLILIPVLYLRFGGSRQAKQVARA
jgi:CzcA family heavy metal efflux pump